MAIQDSTRLDESIERLARSLHTLCDVNAELLAALKNYQNYDLPLEQRQNAAMKAIARAEGREP